MKTQTVNSFASFPTTTDRIGGSLPSSLRKLQTKHHYNNNDRFCTYALSQQQQQTPLPPNKQQLGSFETLNFQEQKKDRIVLLKDMLIDNTNNMDAKKYTPFRSAWDYQKELLEQHFERLTTSSEEGSIPSAFHNQRRSRENSNTWRRGVDTIIMLEHEPVYTLGTGSDESFILSNKKKGEDNDTTTTVPTIRMDRGGEVTYHGPGQLVIYPIIDLRSYKQDIHWYMRALEEAIIMACASIGLQGVDRDEETTGVWVNNEYKIAAIGIKCRKWITMHGIAININDECLSNFKNIVPCGLVGRKVGTINQFLIQQGKSPITIEEFAHVHMKKALEDVFQIQIRKEEQ